MGESAGMRRLLRIPRPDDSAGVAGYREQKKRQKIGSRAWAWGHFRCACLFDHFSLFFFRSPLPPRGAGEDFPPFHPSSLPPHPPSPIGMPSSPPASCPHPASSRRRPIRRRLFAGASLSGRPGRGADRIGDAARPGANNGLWYVDRRRTEGDARSTVFPRVVRIIFGSRRCPTSNHRGACLHAAWLPDGEKGTSGRYTYPSVNARASPSTC